MSDKVRKSLVWNIRKSLLTLSADELYQIAKSIVSVPGRNVSELDAADQEGCFEYINAFMYSTQLLESEDKGMTELLILQETVNSIEQVRTIAATVYQCNDVEANANVDARIIPTTQMSIATDHITTTDTVYLTSPTAVADTGGIRVENTNPDTNPNILHTSYEELSKRLLSYLTTSTQHHTMTQPVTQRNDATQHNNHPEKTTQLVPENVISLRDLSYLQHREFKIQGGQIGDYASDITYTNICRQIEDGIKQNYSDVELIRGILRIIKPGSFKDMLMNKEDMMVEELKGFLQSHLGDKSSTELFQELMCAKQSENETPQQFLYRVIGLKQKILFAAKQTNSDIRYSSATVQDVFLHTIYQGLGHKYKDIRSELKPLLSNHTITDEAILRSVTRITSDENERVRRLGPLTRVKQSTASCAQLESESVREFNEIPEQKNKNDPIKQLTARIDALTSMVDSMRQSKQLAQPEHTRQYSMSKPLSQRGVKSHGCPTCVEAGHNCTHCFLCGEAGHMARGCLQKHRLQGNEKRSLRRDDQ